MKNCTYLLQDDDYETILVSSIENYGDFDFRFAVKISYLEEFLTDQDIKDCGKYEVSLLAVSPEAAGEKNIDIALCSCSDDKYTPQNAPNTEQCRALIEYGIYATLATVQGNNLKNLKSEIHKELIQAQMLFGFYMDRYQNRIGATGWDTITGDNLGSYFRELTNKS